MQDKRWKRNHWVSAPVLCSLDWEISEEFPFGGQVRKEQNKGFTVEFITSYTLRVRGEEMYKS